jgi:membrane associated rhomboid family serine protease
MSDKSSSSRIKPEYRLWLDLIISLLLLPIRFVKFLFGREKFSKVISPLIVIVDAFRNAKFTSSVIFVNIIVFFISVFFFVDYISIFAVYPSDLFNPIRWFSFLTHGFFHASIFHLFGNMFMLFIFGRLVEKDLGSSKTAMVYFSALIFAGIFSSVINLLRGEATGGIGASGALMGLVSVAILLSPFRITFAAIIPMPVMFLGWLMIYADLVGFFTGGTSGIGYSAHIGGFLSAFLLFFILRREQEKMFNGFLINIVTLILVLGVYFIFLN